MWADEYTAVTDLPVEVIWAALRDLHTGDLTYEGADIFELEGPFAIGSELSMTPQGQGTFRSTIVELVENETYADRTLFGGLVLSFRHTLEAVDTGTKVTHRLEIDGESEDISVEELGSQISGDFAESMAALFAEAAKRSRL